jgi:hypothetical protein
MLMLGDVDFDQSPSATVIAACLKEPQILSSHLMDLTWLEVRDFAYEPHEDLDMLISLFGYCFCYCFDIKFINLNKNNI